ncbi:hypothetical protein R1flu_006390 [Riccia fluitans]|uniref:Sodium/metabolite cotransporter BASS1, chloroplastic n=1 Tax=Riccia fluitans TaxID=41844 RepID=A0ABD1YWI6_9MARC
MEVSLAGLPSARLEAFPAALHRGSKSYQGCVKRPGILTASCFKTLNLRTGTGIDRFGVKTSGLIFRKHAPFSSSSIFPQTISFSSGRKWGEIRLFSHAGANAAVPDDGEGASEPTVELQGWERKAELIGEALSSAFPSWVALACIVALVWPASTGWIDQRVQVFGITVTMLGMGMTLTLKDFQGAFRMPKELLAGVLLQYTVMPASGYFVSRLLQLPPHYAAGLILVACCPGGTASNIVTYLARGNVALSVLMTAASTFLAVVMTPVLTAKLVGQYVAVDAASLFFSTVQVVLLPVLGGAIMNYFFKNAVKKVALLAPSIAVFMVAIVCAGAVGRSAAAILSSGGQILLAVCALHGCGFAGGYLLSKLLRLGESSCRTISIEVGMQNSVLGVVLAGQHFSNPLTAVPCALSSVCHSIIGSTLAGMWRLKPTNVNDNEDNDKSLSS